MFRWIIVSGITDAYIYYLCLPDMSELLFW